MELIVEVEKQLCNCLEHLLGGLQQSAMGQLCERCDIGAQGDIWMCLGMTCLSPKPGPLR